MDNDKVNVWVPISVLDETKNRLVDIQFKFFTENRYKLSYDRLINILLDSYEKEKKRKDEVKNEKLNGNKNSDIE